MTPRAAFVEAERAAFDLVQAHFNLNAAGLGEWRRLAKERVRAFADLEEVPTCYL